MVFILSFLDPPVLLRILVFTVHLMALKVATEMVLIGNVSTISIKAMILVHFTIIENVCLVVIEIVEATNAANFTELVVSMFHFDDFLNGCNLEIVTEFQLVLVDQFLDVKSLLLDCLIEETHFIIDIEQILEWTIKHILNNLVLVLLVLSQVTELALFNFPVGEFKF